MLPPASPRTTILYTSFDTWSNEQDENSSDALAEVLQDYEYANVVFVRKLPVNTQAAFERIEPLLRSMRPSVVLLSGMTEARGDANTLFLEQYARSSDENICLETPIDTARIVSLVPNTALSTDAGQFVCEQLYYTVMQAAQNLATEDGHSIKTLFVHVPYMTPKKRTNLILAMMTTLRLIGAVSGLSI